MTKLQIKLKKLFHKPSYEESKKFLKESPFNNLKSDIGFAFNKYYKNDRLEYTPETGYIWINN